MHLSHILTDHLQILKKFDTSSQYIVSVTITSFLVFRVFNYNFRGLIQTHQLYLFTVDKYNGQESNIHCCYLHHHNY